MFISLRTTSGARFDMLIALERAGDIPKGLRIGVQHFTNARRDDWTYDPVHPPGLGEFRLI